MRSRKSAAVLIAAAAMTGAVLMAGAPSASADSGGNGNPATPGLCPNAQTVASANILNGSVVVGLIEMRWSAACSGNWTRVTSYIGTQWLIADIREDPNASITARGENLATQNWSPYLHVAPSQRMCSTGIIIVDDSHSYFGGVCSN